MNLHTATPAEIDSKLEELLTKAACLEEDVVRAERTIDAYSCGSFATFYAAKLEAAEHAKTKALARMVEVRAGVAELNAEFDRRGGWTRAFIVAGGHVHSSRSCSSCYVTTRFGWLPQVSGLDEAEIVEQAGDRACTVCYPSAPVVTRPSALFHADELEAAKARDARNARKAELAAKREAAAIGPIRTDAQVIRTVTAARSFLTDAAEFPNHPWYGRQDVDTVAAALATKLGTTADAELVSAGKRAAKRR